MSAAGRHRRAHPRRRRVGSLAGLTAAAALLPTLATPSAHAASLLPEGPSTVRTLSPLPFGYINTTLNGAVCAAPSTCTPIPYLTFVTPTGTAALDTVLKDNPDEPVVILAYSNGAQAAEYWIAEHANDPDAPPAENVTFIFMGNSIRKYGGADKEFGISQPSQYKVIDVAREYDPVADFPDNPANLLALANALAGGFSMHDYRDVDIDDPNNIVWTEGNTTYVLVPTEKLPLLDPLRVVGLNAVADQLNDPLKEIVDQGYDRSYIPADEPAVTKTVAAPAVKSAPEVEPAPSVESASTTDKSVKEAVVEVDSESDADESVTKKPRSTKATPVADAVDDTVRTITKTATRELDKLTKPLRSLREEKKPANDAPAKRDTSSASSDSGGSAE
ncbi:PE-PPE domain-containing protein [Mycolicibacterium sp. 3033]|nr:PE-PPE domain-containing protein [Mycolicibacterium aurantiacum]